MTLTHELGHIIGGALGGATLTDMELRPWRLPYSIHSPDPHPLLTLWSGPILGVLVPVLVALVVPWRPLWFVANFCVLANGTYLALAWFAGDPHLDTPRLMHAGASSVSVAIYCLLTIGVGYPRFRNDCIDWLSGPQPKRPTQERDSTDTPPN